MNNLRVMLLGASGQVGSECHALLKEMPCSLSALYRKDVDFTDEPSIRNSVIDFKPDIVINACAHTAVDKAESEPDLAFQINSRGVAVLANVCDQVGAALIHISTDYVFDGQSSSPYCEEDTTCPLGVYGESKLAGEQGVIHNLTEHIILRTSWVFGRNGNNFVKTMLRLAKERDQLSIVDDQRGCPTYALHIAQSIVSLVERFAKTGALPWGIYHCCDHDDVTWYEFAKAIFQQASDSGQLSKIPRTEPIPSSQYPTPVPRPTYSVLSVDKLEALLGHKLPSWRDGLQHFFMHQ